MPSSTVFAIGWLLVGLVVGMAGASLVFYAVDQTHPAVVTSTSTSTVYTTYTTSNPSPCTVFQGSDGRITTTCSYSSTTTTTTQYLTVTSTETITIRTGS